MSHTVHFISQLQSIAALWHVPNYSRMVQKSEATTYEGSHIQKAKIVQIGSGTAKI